MDEIRRRTAFTLTGMIAAMFMTDVLVAGASNEPHSLASAVYSGIIFGQFIGQFNLVSFWAAVSQGSWICRLPWALLLTVAMWTALIIGFRIPVNGIDYRDAVEMGILMAIGTIAAQLPMWLAAKVMQLKLTQKLGIDTLEPEQAETQFNIRQMLLGTVMLSASLALGRAFLPHRSPGADFSFMLLKNHFTYVFLAAVIACNLALVVPCIWLVFRMRLTALRGFAIALGVTIVSLLEFAGLCLILGSPGNISEWGLFFVVFNLTQVAFVMTVLSVLRRFLRFELVGSLSHESQ